MTTPGADIMSSPDPLIESVGTHVIVPSSAARRTTKSRRSSKARSRSASPRKQTFELQVGDDQAPQKLFVTVESGDGRVGVGESGARRRLFQSSSPISTMRRRERATTTTVPLKETIEEELETPRKRGRPRKSNGTPLPGAGAKRRAGTPIKRTPRRPRTSKTVETGGASRESSVQPTPRSGRRGRPPKNFSVEPSSELGTESVRNASSTKRGRPRRKALVPAELIEMAEEAAEASMFLDEAEEVIMVRTSPETGIDESPVDAAPQVDDDAESDIWMATLDDEPTPKAANRSAQLPHVQSPPIEPQQLPEQEPALEPEDEASEVGDYGYLPPAASDVSSVDEPSSAARPRNNDTIAQGEDFSMIFMDSLPSLQETLRSSMHEISHNDFGEETSLIINNTLESLRQQSAREFEAEAFDAEEPSLPVLQPQAPTEPQLSATRPSITLSPNRNRIGNLSPRWNQSPRRGGLSPLRQQVLKSKAQQIEATPRRIDGGQEHSSARTQRSKISTRRDDGSNLYDDSFSEIPQNVLEAATPGRPAAIMVTEEDDEIEEDVEEEPDHEEDVQETQEQTRPPTASNTSVVSRSDAGRLPTPDNTPPHLEGEVVHPQDKSSQVIHSSPLAVSSVPSQVMPETVQEVEEVIEEEELEEVEVVRVESYDDAASLDIPRPQQHTLLADERIPQIEVTPINQMTSPLQEPQSVAPDATHEKTLRPALSPIVRAGRALQSVTSDPPSPEPREHQLRSPFRSSASKEAGLAGRAMSASPRRPLVYQEVTQIPPVNEVYGDPFGTETRHTGQASFMQALGRSSIGPPKNHISSRESTASSMRITPPSEDEMSWVANEGPISANLRGDIPLKEVAQLAAAGAVSEAVSQGHLADDEDEDDERNEVIDDETDIWEFEAKRTTPRSTRQQSFGKKVPVPAYRRSAIPSPWMRQKSPERPGHGVTRQSPGKEQQRFEAPRLQASTAQVSAPEPMDVEEYSLLAQREIAQQNRVPESANKASRFDLSAFFSSPAAIPGKLAEKFLPGRTSVFGARTNEPQVPREATTLPTSSMFPQVAQKEFQPGNTRSGLFPAERGSEMDETIELGSTNETPERSRMPSVAQKKDFTPRPRQQDNQSFFQASNRSGAPTPPRMQLSHADIERWQQETSNASEDSPDFRRPILRPLPPRNASPTKSSLRSPMKPHTPGRVVEFTSSVLSPVEQAKARQQRRLSNSSTSQIGSFQRPAPPPQTANKENLNTSDISMSEPSPMAKPPQVQPLSQTAWTRQHWLLLDELLQLRREGAYELNYERRADRYLGKTVKSQGEAMRLERWHLDCVDAFKAEVGGWDEGVLAKRLFALILGEERRRRGMVDRRQRVMFH